MDARSHDFSVSLDVVVHCHGLQALAHELRYLLALELALGIIVKVVEGKNVYLLEHRELHAHRSVTLGEAQSSVRDDFLSFSRGLRSLGRGNFGGSELNLGSFVFGEDLLER